MKLKLIIGIVGILSACGFTNAPSLDTNQEKQDNNWVIGPFLRPEGVNPVISPQPTEFYCPMRKQQVKWEESDTFNPAATVKDGKIVVLYRAEDNSAQGIGKRTSRVGYAESKDGIEMKRLDNPVLFPAEDNFKDQDWPCFLQIQTDYCFVCVRCITWAGITTRITWDGSLSERTHVVAVTCLSMRWLPVLRHPEQMHFCCMLPPRQVWHM